MRLSLLLIFLFIFTGINFIHAQEADTGSAKKPWFLTFNFDIKVKSLGGSINDYYKGEYYDYNSGSLDNRWTWVEQKNNKAGIFPEYKLNNMKLDVMIGRSRGLRFGMSYTFGLLESIYDIHGYLAISAIAEYQYNFIKEKETSPFVFGSLALGSYRGTSSIQGPGTELFGQGRAGVGFEAPRGWMLRIWGSTDYLYYRESSNSQIFNRTQSIKTDLNIFYAGIGFTKQVKLIPD